MHRACRNASLVALALVTLGAASARADEIDLTGTWLAESNCGSGPDTAATSTFDIVANPLDGSFSATPIGCQTGAGQPPSSCSFDPAPPFSGRVTGTSFLMPQSGSVEQTVTYSPPMPFGFCPAGVATSVADGRWSGTIGADLAITGVLDVAQVSFVGPSATVCFQSTNFTCPLLMRRVDAAHPGCFIDHVRSTTEDCDDGNTSDGDGCDQNCTLTACGNGIATSGEECDGTEAASCASGCSPNCRCVACGNAWLDPGEDCDDGNITDGDGCSSTCHDELLDVTGSWQATTDCGGGPVGTLLLSLAGSGSAVEATWVCDGSTSLWDDRVTPWQSCGTSPSPVIASAVGTAFALPGSGTATQSVTFANPSATGNCGAVPIGGTDVTFTGGGTIEGALGRATRIDGMDTVLSVAYRDAQGNVCTSATGLNVSCRFIMRRNEVTPGLATSVSPRDGSVVTFDQVTSSGGTVAITQLPEAQGEVTANFQSNGNVAPFFEVKPTGVDYAGSIETCLPYRDADDDGFVDDSTPPLAEADVKLLHLENGVFVDRTTRIDPVGNFVCARTDSLSPFFMGVDAAAATARPVSGKKLLVSAKPGDASKTVLVALSKDSALGLGNGNLSADDPVLHGGSVRIRSTAAGYDRTFVLPASGWKRIGKPGQNKGYVFTAKTGTIRKAQLKPGPKSGLLAVTAKGAEVALALGSDPRPIDVVLTVGAQRSCASFGGAATFDTGKKLLAKDAAAPAACP